MLFVEIEFRMSVRGATSHNFHRVMEKDKTELQHPWHLHPYSTERKVKTQIKPYATTASSGHSSDTISREAVAPSFSLSHSLSLLPLLLPPLGFSRQAPPLFPLLRLPSLDGIDSCRAGIQRSAILSIFFHISLVLSLPFDARIDNCVVIFLCSTHHLHCFD